MAPTPYYGGIEAGGTKFVCLVATGPEDILARHRLRTTGPGVTLGRVIDFFRPHVQAGRLRSMGVGCFGPVDLDPGSSTYGQITSTPKVGWANTKIAWTLQRALRIPVHITTDVNAAGLGEARWGASSGVDPSLYLTVGTGIGGGYIREGHPLVGLLHPEMGHIRIPHDLSADPFPGRCPFHGDCFEGLASGPAIRDRFGVEGETLPDEHPFWDLEAEYIAAALVNSILTLVPGRIVLGGGVMRRSLLFPKIRAGVLRKLNKYFRHPAVLDHVVDYIVPPSLGDLSGSLGAIAFAQLAEGG